MINNGLIIDDIYRGFNYPIRVGIAVKWILK